MVIPRAGVALVLALVLGPAGAADTPPVDADWLRQVEQGVEAAREKHGEDIQALVEQDRERARQALDPEQSPLGVVRDAPVAAADPSLAAVANVRYRVFVSQAMPLGELRALADLSRDRGDLVLVFRGYPPGQGPTQFMSFVQRLVGHVEQGQPLPRIQLDPPRFESEGITRVPTLVAYDAAGQAVLVAPGTGAPAYAQRVMAQGRKGVLPPAGPTVPVSEPDLVAQMKASVKDLDLDQMRREALARLWQDLPTYSLPSPTKFTRTRFDPSFVVTQAITAPDGRPLALPGQRVNPLEVLPFTQELVIFDPGDPRQILTARALRLQAKGRITLIATRLPVDDLAGYEALSAKLGAPVTLVTPAILEQFRITHVPVRVRAQDLQFVLEAFVPGTAPPGPGARPKGGS